MSGEGENTQETVNDGTGSVGAGVDLDTRIDPGNEFLQQIPESYRDRDYLQGIDSMEKFVEQFDNVQKLIGKKKVGVPTDESPIEEWNKFYDQMGRPEDPSGYEYDLPELPEAFQRTEEDLQHMSKIFHEAGLTKKQAQLVLQKTDEAVKEYYEQNKEKMEEMRVKESEEFQKKLEQYFGKEKDDAVAVTETMLKKYVPKGLEDAVKGLDDQTMLVLSSVLHNVHKAGKTEDSIEKDVEQTPSETPESLRETAKKLMMSPEWRDEFHPNHDAVKKRVQSIYQKIAGA